MNRIFGLGGKKAPPPTLNAAVANVDARTTTLDEKIKKLEGEITQYKDQMRRLPEGPSKNRIKAKAVNAIKQRNMYENAREQHTQQSFNMDMVMSMQDSMKNASVTVQAMKQSNAAMKKQFKELDVDKVDDIMFEASELMDQGNEVQEIMSQNLSMPFDVDESELDAELNELELGLDSGLSNELGSGLGNELDSVQGGIPSYLRGHGNVLPDLPELLPEGPSGAGVQYASSPGGQKVPSTTAEPLSKEPALRL
ncbi:Snf7-domain-containing protein [Coemansia reversa NRRL 1564]|uniref:Snf7-domain-containing protein n=1 Tax=Coemansia reversa (strain ATCC 12441 / NRRL 1564) TaxID=763665 RepID=A0A2G5BD14_COERN|nr:Snf7-domain-containing protein [Coemansia reversa NRRL 1564]|eukprot:PIA16908.1 Snf7-domain-containing protein [Coemansia reversa NRRL 1564]